MFKCWHTCTPHTIGLLSNSSQLRGSAYPGSESGSYPGTAKCPEPLCLAPVLPSRGRHLASPRRALPPHLRSYRLMRQTFALLSPSALPSDSRSLQVAASPCCAMALPVAISVIPSLRVWTPTPASPKVLSPVSSLGTLTFPKKELGRHPAYPQQLISVEINFRSCSHSLMFRPASLLASPIVPTLSYFYDGQPRLLRPRISRLVTRPVQWIC